MSDVPAFYEHSRESRTMIPPSPPWLKWFVPHIKVWIWKQAIKSQTNKQKLLNLHQEYPKSSCLHFVYRLQFVRFRSEARGQLVRFRSFHFQDLISNSPYCLLWYSYDESSENLALAQLKYPDSFFFSSHYLSAWYCIDVIGRNSILITQGNWGVEVIRVKD